MTTPTSTSETWPVRATLAQALSLLVLAATVSSGCAARSKDKSIVMAWPEPPEQPRIQLVRTVASELDLKGKSVAQTVSDFVIGRRREIWHLNQPLALAVSDDGKRLYVADYAQLFVYIFDFDKKKVTLIGNERPLGRPVGVALDVAENLYVVDQENRRILVFDPAHNLTRALPLTEADRPTGIAIDRARGLLYVADSSTGKSTEHFVRVYNLDGQFLRNVGNGRGDRDGYLQFPTYLLVDSTGNLYVSDTMNSRVCVFDPEGNFLRFFGGRGDRWGEMNHPKGVALDSFGNVYVVDSAWSVVQIFNQQRQVLLTFGGRNRFPGMFQNPTAIAIDRNNRIYVADTFNFRVNVYDLVNTTAQDSTVPLPLKQGGDGGPKGTAATQVSSKSNWKGVEQ